MLNKKTQLLTLAVALLIPCGAHANDIGGTAADPDDNQEFQDVYMSTTAIVIDGDLSEWNFPTITDPLIGIPKIGRDDRVDGDPPGEFVIHETLGGVWTGTDDQSSTTQLAWDADGLYIGIVVTDDYHENAANSGWNGDALQMMITTDDRASDFALYNYALGGIEEELDPDPNPPFDSSFGDFVVNHERGFASFLSDEELLRGFEDEPNTGVAIVRDALARTTTYELFLPAEALGKEVAEMVEGTQLGFAVTINDGDADFPGQTGWVGLGAHSIVFGKTPSEAALLTFVGEFTGPPSECPVGDIDGDCAVGFSDFLILSANFGMAGDASGGDLDGDGQVGFPDFLLLSANFGQSGVAAAATVPEPSSLGLLGLSVLFLGCLRRRRNG